MPSGFGGARSQGGAGGGNYPQFPQLPGMGGSGQVNPMNLGYNPITGEPTPGAGGVGGVPGVPGTLPTPPNLTEVQANPQLQQVFQTMFGKVGTSNPLLEENLANIRGRMSADTTQRAIDRASGTIQDQLAGALQANKERGQGRGGGGTAAGELALTESAQRNAARASADISLGRERDLDALAMGALPSYAAPGQREMGWANAAGGAANASASNQLGAAGQALSAWQAQVQAQQAAQQMAMQQQMAMLNMYQSLWS